MSTNTAETAHSSRPRHSGRHRSSMAPGALRVRWPALATGSVTGIAIWAFLYVLGAALAGSCNQGELPSGGPLLWVLGLYGAVAASAALWAGSFVASASGGANCRGAGALYGLSMWGMASITLVAVSIALSAGFGQQLAGPAASMLGVGAAALGSGFATGSGATGVTLWGMVAVMVLSLPVAIAGGTRGARL